MTNTTPNSPDLIRQRLKAAYQLVDKTYVEMGRDLYATYHGRLFIGWGFDTFNDYVAKELGMDTKKAERVRGIHAHYVQACGLAPSTVEQIGFFNCITLKTVITPENAKERIPVVLGMSSSRAVTKQAAAWKKLDAPQDPEDDGEAEDEESEEDGAIVNLNVKLHPSQHKVVAAALDEARRAKATELPLNEALANIATEFLASRMAKEDEPVTRMAYMLGVLEKVYGGKIVWIQNDQAAAVLMEAMEAHPDLFGEALSDDEDDDTDIDNEEDDF